MSLFGGLLKSTIGTVLDRVIPDTNARREAAERIEQIDLEQEFQVILGQIEVNKVEAAHKSLLVAGWRPAIGWVCGAGLAYNVLMQPILSIWVEMPPVQTEMLYPVLMGMLGLGGMRSYEKMRRVSRER